jgi:hypothetical protein
MGVQDQAGKLLPADGKKQLLTAASNLLPGLNL